MKRPSGHPSSGERQARDANMAAREAQKAREDPAGCDHPESQAVEEKLLENLPIPHLSPN